RTDTPSKPRLERTGARLARHVGQQWAPAAQPQDVRRSEVRLVEPFWSMLAAPAVAAFGAARLHARRPLIYWTVCCVLTAAVAAPFYYLAARHPAPPFNAPSVLAAVFIVLPTLVTFAIERSWFALGNAVSRPFATAALSLPLALLAYVLGLFVAIVIGT